jgi:hypothetical protein
MRKPTGLLNVIPPMKVISVYPNMTQSSCDHASSSKCHQNQREICVISAMRIPCSVRIGVQLHLQVADLILELLVFGPELCVLGLQRLILRLLIFVHLLPALSDLFCTTGFFLGLGDFLLLRCHGSLELLDGLRRSLKLLVS